MSKINHFSHIDDVTGVYFLAFIGGFIDAAGYLKLQGIFTSSITGNVVAACTSVITSPYGVLCRVLVTLVFVLAAALLSGAGLRLKLVNKFKERSLITFYLIIELIMLIGVWIVGQYYLNFLNSNQVTLESPQLILVGCFMAASMGFQSIAAKEINAAAPSTTVITTTLVNNASNFATTIGYAVASKSAKWSSKNNTSSNSSLTEVNIENDNSKLFESKVDESFLKFLSAFYPLIIFISGALIGATTIFYGDFWSISIPIAIILFLLFEVYIKPSPTGTGNA